jgi:hypothetical protein
MDTIVVTPTNAAMRIPPLSAFGSTAWGEPTCLLTFAALSCVLPSRARSAYAPEGCSCTMSRNSVHEATTSVSPPKSDISWVRILGEPSARRARRAKETVRTGARPEK